MKKDLPDPGEPTKRTNSCSRVLLKVTAGYVSALSCHEKVLTEDVSQLSTCIDMDICNAVVD